MFVTHEDWNAMLVLSVQYMHQKRLPRERTTHAKRERRNREKGREDEDSVSESRLLLSILSGVYVRQQLV